LLAGLVLTTTLLAQRHVENVAHAWHMLCKQEYAALAIPAQQQVLLVQQDQASRHVCIAALQRKDTNRRSSLVSALKCNHNHIHL
jgi:hypothetical protein